MQNFMFWSELYQHNKMQRYSLAQNQYFEYLAGPMFQGVSRLVVLSFENDANRTGCTEYYLPKVQIKDYVYINISNHLYLLSLLR